MKLINGECLEEMRSMQDNSVTSIVTDPPYGLKFMGKKWDYEIPSVEIWKECLRVLKPGGTLLCFAGSRTQHRMAVNIEDAGFTLKDTIMWVYGSGFPKAADIGKNVDKLLNNERKKFLNPLAKKQTAFKQTTCFGDYNATTYITKGNTKWEGWKSHSIKPAYEPIILAIKPNDGTYANNALKYSVAGLNIDGSRVGVDNMLNHGGGINKEGRKYGNGKGIPTIKKGVSVHKGRFPANLIHDGSEEVLECFPITGKSSGGSGKATTDKCGYKNNGIQFDGYKKGYEAEGLGGYGDSDSAARYFKTCPILDEDIEIQRLFYTAKASKKERNEGIESFEDKIGGSLLGTADKSLLNGSGNVRNNLMRNNHPTVKPLKLMEYLVGLVTMPENTLILDPFMGSGTTGIACKNKDVDFIGIELNEDYFKIAEERIKKG